MLLSHRFAAWACVLGTSALFASPASGAADPCFTGYIAGDGVRGVDGYVYGSTMWDPDGPGPRTPVLVIVGSFEFAGTAHTNNVASYDPATGEWGSFGSGISTGNLLYAATVLTNGDLIVAGSFSVADGSAANSVARWDTATSSWKQLGNGITGGFVTCLTPLANGGLVAGGNFYTLNNGPAGHIARWDGTSWSNMNGGVTAPSSIEIFSLTTLANGDVIAGGLFTAAGGVPAQNIARWSPAGGGSWSAFGSGADGLVTALAPLPGNAFVAGGSFNTINGNAISGIARFNPAGATWSSFGAGPTGGVSTIRPLANGDMLVGGYFQTSGPISTPHIARWTAATNTWSTIGGGTNNVVRSISVFSNGNFAACGDMTEINGLPGRGVQVWNGSAWINWPGFGATILAITDLPNGDTLAAGYFETAGTGTAHRIARKTGDSWTPIGAGVEGTPYALLALPDSSFIVGGSITLAGNVAVSNIAKCSSTGVWSALGDGIGGDVYALCRLANGDILAGGSFDTPASYVARWNGSTWASLGDGPGGTVNTLVQMPNGDIVAGGEFSIDGGAVGDRIAVWKGTEWLPMGDGFDGDVHALALLKNGDLIAAGAFTHSGAADIAHIARWNGSAWLPLDSGLNDTVRALAVIDSGDLIVGGQFTGNSSLYCVGIMRWTGTEWLQMGFGVRGTVYALAHAPNNSVHIGGTFLGVGAGGFSGGLSSPYYADWTSGDLAVTLQPAPASNCPTGVAAFTFEVSSKSPLTYQWYLNDLPVDPGINPTALDATLVLDHPTIDNAGTYYCIASNDCGTVTSGTADLTLQSCCPADLNLDGLVDDNDFQIFVVAYDILDCADESMPAGCPSDLNRDAVVDDLDFQVFAVAYNELLCP